MDTNQTFAGGIAVLTLFGCMVGILCFVIWIWSIVDCVQREFEEENEKIVWILVIILTGIIGSIIYLLVGTSRGTKPA